MPRLVEKVLSGGILNRQVPGATYHSPRIIY